jgi:NADPH-dependent 2,4-dienoyl-CoA reductase/sulfur reductase-like enzyme/rhodanese-related sulfurtransferase
MPKKIVIVGGVAGGASFAARMRRLDEHAHIIMFEKGQYISFANCGLPYYIGGIIENREDLLIQSPPSFKSRYNVDVRINSEVTAIDTVAKKVTVRSNASVYEETYDYLVLSPGSAAFRPPLKGIDHDRIFVLRTIPDMDRIRACIDNNAAKKAVVIGGGFIGLEMAENFRSRGLEVTLVEVADQVFIAADREIAHILHKHLEHKGVKLILGDGVKEFTKTPPGRLSVVLASGRTIDADLALLAIGVKPDTAFIARAVISLSEKGAIVVDAHMRTSVNNIFAIGDAVEVNDPVSSAKVLVPLAGPANRQARVAADTIAGLESMYRGTQGSAICKVFDLAAAVTGINEKAALRHGIDYVKSYTHADHHAYYPGASLMTIKILFDPKSGKLLGAQIVGAEGVDKRIDVLATAIGHGLTVDDLADLELAYAPPYGSAKDPVNIAGSVASNILSGRMKILHAGDLGSSAPDTRLLLDVRTRGEHSHGAIPGSINIPLDELRARLIELDRSREILAYCRVGMRGYLACRILEQNGFRARNLSGGYLTWESVQNSEAASFPTKDAV